MSCSGRLHSEERSRERRRQFEMAVALDEGHAEPYFIWPTSSAAVADCADA